MGECGWGCFGRLLKSGLIAIPAKHTVGAYLGYSECTPTSAMPASSLHAFVNANSRLPAQGVFIELGIDRVDTGLRS